MNIEKISDRKLLENAKNLVKIERDITSKILTHLYEIERRRLYCDLKYSSLFEYATKELEYSESGAYRRINAMRISRKVPEIKKQIDKGTMTLTNVNLVGDLFKEAKIEDKNLQLDIVKQVINTTKRKCESRLDNIRAKLNISPAKKKEVSQRDGADRTRIHISLKNSTMKKIQKLKGLLAHQKDMELSELIDLMASNMVEKIEREKFIKVRKSKGQNRRGRYITKELKSNLYAKSSGKCENCGSSYALQVDHMIPFSRRGKSEASNLQILCRKCNQRKAIKDYGQSKMDRFLNFTSPEKLELANFFSGTRSAAKSVKQ